MAKAVLNLLDTAIGNIVFNAQQAANVGAAFGNGALTAGALANSSTNAIGDDGNINIQISAAGISPGATGVDSVLAVFSIPAACFDMANRGINIMACGSIVN